MVVSELVTAAIQLLIAFASSFAAIMAAFWLGEKLRPSFAVGAVVTFLGLALLTNVFSTQAHPGFYDFVALVVALASAYVVVTIRQLHGTEHTSTIFGAQCVYGLLLCAIPAALQPESIPALGWLLLFIASLTAGLGQITMTLAFLHLPAGEGSLWQMLVPVGVAVGVAGEPSSKVRRSLAFSDRTVGILNMEMSAHLSHHENSGSVSAGGRHRGRVAVSAAG